MSKKCDKCGEDEAWLNAYDKQYCSYKCCTGEEDKSKTFSAMVCGGCILLAGAFILIAVIMENVK